MAQEREYRTLPNMAGLTMTYDRYGEDLEPWQRVKAEFRRFTDYGPLIVNGYAGHRFDITDYQGEFEFWPNFGESWYGHLQLGISGGDLFPDYRAGAEYYRILPKGWESSLGLRYLNFGENDALLITGSISKYAGDWLLIARPFYSPQESGSSVSLNLTARRYFGNPNTFATIMGGFGFSPDEQRLVEGFDGESFLRSRFISLVGNRLFADRFEIFGELKATDQEFPFTDNFVRIYTFEVGSRIRF
ncbi:MAG: YaiO family outer membrane beta-barrel protein [Balneolaceae bacterium]|nr:YaiO family outer membrane beta-barrel protein [Balneolaceae bacterium]MCH8547659.1 YaiO family outer membrane beta-barrel protein [Balneolaceae bacterium]